MVVGMWRDDKTSSGHTGICPIKLNHSRQDQLRGGRIENQHWAAKLHWVFFLADKWIRPQKAFAENISFHTKTQAAENESFSGERVKIIFCKKFCWESEQSSDIWVNTARRKMLLDGLYELLNRRYPSLSVLLCLLSQQRDNKFPSPYTHYTPHHPPYTTTTIQHPQ